MFLALMRIQKIIILFGFCIAVCFMTGAAYAFPSKANSLYFAQTDKFPPAQKITHTIQKGESLWTIARYFGVDLSKVVALNNLDNPDLIFPGKKLVIEIQKDQSIRVTAGPAAIELPVFPVRESQPIARVVLPDKDNIFAPEVPVASYQKKDVISQQRGTRLGTFTVVFKSFLEFVEWLSGESAQHKQAQASGPHHVDPSPASPYTTSSAFHQEAPFGTGQDIFAQPTFFNSHISDSLSPPPKS